MRNLLKQGAQLYWAPDSDAVNAPDGALLRADNVVKDEQGALCVRRGYEATYENLTGGGQTTGVNTVYSCELPVPDADGTRYDVAVSGEKLWLNSNSAAPTTMVDQGVTLDGSGDAAIGDDAYQIFIARGSSKYKWNGSQLHNWDIAAPIAKPTLAAATATIKTIFEFDTSETIAGTVTVHEGSGVNATGYDGSANGCYELTPDPKSGRASISNVFTAVQNCLNIPGTIGSDTDLIDFYVWLEEPRKVDRITLMFGLNSSGDPFLTDYYKFTFDISGKGGADIKDPITAGVGAYSSSASKKISAVDPRELTKAKSPTEVAKTLKRIGRFSGPRALTREDAQQNSPAWTHFSVTRGKFERVGGTSGVDWSTVKAVKIVYAAIPGSTEKVRLDDLKIIGGGERVLTGTFRCVFRFVHDTGNYIELSPPSPESTEIVLNQQSLSVTIPAAAINAADAQVNQIWVYLYGGYLDQYYRVLVTSSENTNVMSTDEFDPSADSTIAAADRLRLTSLEFNVGDAGSSDITASVRKSEVDILLENEVLEPGGMGIPSNIVAIAGPWHNRLILVTDEGWVYPTSQTSPSNCNSYHVLDLRRYGDPMWAVKTNGGIYVGLTKDIVRIGGSGDESEDRLSVDLYPEPLNVANPPVDRCVYTDGNTVVFRSADGPMFINGISVSAVPLGATSLLWRGYDRHGIDAVNQTTGRFRMATDNGILYMLVTEGSSNTSPTSLWRINLIGGEQTWSRYVYPDTLLSIFRDKSGRLLAGTSAGSVLTLETGLQDDTENIDVEIWWPWLGDPLTRSVPLDIQLHVNTGGDTGTLNFYVDGSGVLNRSFSFDTSTDTVFRIDATDISDFLKIQPRISGSFDTFKLRMWNMTIRPLVQHAMVVDTDYLIPPEPQDMIWLQEAEVDAISPSNLTFYLYVDDVLKSSCTQTVTVTPNVRTVYPVPLPRGVKGRRCRAVIKTTASNDEGQIGFECFRVRFREVGSGNFYEVPFQTTTPVGQ